MSNFSCRAVCHAAATGMRAALSAPFPDHTLFVAHQATDLALLCLGALVLAPTTLYFRRHFKQCNSVVKAFSSVLMADWGLVFIFLPETARALAVGKVEDGPWCKLLGWGSLIQLTALLFSAVVVSHATWRLVTNRPLNDEDVFMNVVASWVVPVIVASGFWGAQLVGPYKNLYCCVRDDAYVAGAAAATEIFVFGSAVVAGYFYVRSWWVVREMERDAPLLLGKQQLDMRASRIVMRRGMLLVSLLFFWWSLIIAVGFITMMGRQTPALLDVLSTKLVKCMPVFDAIFIWRMVAKVVARGVVAPSLQDRQAVASRGQGSASYKPADAAGRKGSGSSRPDLAAPLPPLREANDVESGSNSSTERRQGPAVG